jgi:hypothetical protein
VREVGGVAANGSANQANRRTNQSKVYKAEVYAARLIMVAQILGIAGGLIGFIGLTVAYRILTSQQGNQGGGSGTSVPTVH